MIPSIVEARVASEIPSVESYHGGNDSIVKLREQANEFRDATPDNRPEELADVLEVVRALTAHLEVTDAALDDVAADKRSELVGFGQRIWLE